MTKSLRAVSSIALFLAFANANSFDIKQGHYLFEIGAFRSTQGKTQNILIQGLIGDRFNVIHQNSTNALFGLGYRVLAARPRDSING